VPLVDRWDTLLKIVQTNQNVSTGSWDTKLAQADDSSNAARDSFESVGSFLMAHQKWTI